MDPPPGVKKRLPLVVAIFRKKSKTKYHAEDQGGTRQSCICAQTKLWKMWCNIFWYSFATSRGPSPWRQGILNRNWVRKCYAFPSQLCRHQKSEHDVHIPSCTLSFFHAFQSLPPQEGAGHTLCFLAPWCMATVSHLHSRATVCKVILDGGSSFPDALQGTSLLGADCSLVNLEQFLAKIRPGCFSNSDLPTRVPSKWPPTTHPSSVPEWAGGD